MGKSIKQKYQSKHQRYDIRKIQGEEIWTLQGFAFHSRGQIRLLAPRVRGTRSWHSPRCRWCLLHVLFTGYIQPSFTFGKKRSYSNWLISERVFQPPSSKFWFSSFPMHFFIMHPTYLRKEESLSSEWTTGQLPNWIQAVLITGSGLTADTFAVSSCFGPLELPKRLESWFKLDANLPVARPLMTRDAEENRGSLVRCAHVSLCPSFAHTSLVHDIVQSA